MIQWIKEHGWSYTLNCPVLFVYCMMDNYDFKEYLKSINVPDTAIHGWHSNEWNENYTTWRDSIK
jgi:hypothetical protein